jgi:hypothetical protein
VQCALDSYLLPIIDAIEEATGKSFDSSEGVISPNPARPELVVLPQSLR